MQDEIIYTLYNVTRHSYYENFSYLPLVFPLGMLIFVTMGCIFVGLTHTINETY